MDLRVDRELAGAGREVARLCKLRTGVGGCGDRLERMLQAVSDGEGKVLQSRCRMGRSLGGGFVGGGVRWAAPSTQLAKLRYFLRLLRPLDVRLLPSCGAGREVARLCKLREGAACCGSRLERKLQAVSDREGKVLKSRCRMARNLVVGFAGGGVRWAAPSTQLAKSRYFNPSASTAGTRSRHEWSGRR